MGICRFFSVFHIRDDRLPLIVTDLPFAIHVNDADAGNRPFGIVHYLVIPGERVGAARDFHLPSVPSTQKTSSSP